MPENHDSLVRGAAPTPIGALEIAGAPHPDLSGGLVTMAPFLRAQGVGAIITLFEKPLEPNPAELGFQYLFVETLNFRPPPDLGSVLAFIEAQLERSCGVLVHCFAGIGRTGTVLAAWLIRQAPELSAAAALARELKKVPGTIDCP